MTRHLVLALVLALTLIGCSSSSGDDVNGPNNTDTSKDGVSDNDQGEQQDLHQPDTDGMAEDTGNVDPDVIEEDLLLDDTLEDLFIDDTGVDPEDVDQISGELPDEDTPEDLEIVEDTGIEPEGDQFFKSAELGIKILGPSATGKAQALGASIQVAGLVLGKPDAIIWESETTGDSGYAEGMPFFLSGKVELIQGDNIIHVTASQAGETATDTVIISYNPAFLFGDELRVRPNAMFVNTQASLVFNLNMGLYANFEPSTLKLCECTEGGVCVSDVHTLMDDGQVSISGDEVGEDSVYSWKKTYQTAEPGKLCFRAHVVVKAGYQQYTAYSPVVCVDVVEHFTQEECTEIKTLQQEAQQLYIETFEASDPGTARQAVIAFLQEQPEVLEVGGSYQGYGVWVRYDSGVLGAFNFNAAGMRGGENDEDEGLEQIGAPLGMQEIRIASKRSTALAPGHSEFGINDETAFAFNLMDKSECPAFVLDGPFNDAQSSLARFRNMKDYGVIAVAGHGDSYFKQMTEEAKEDYDWVHRKSQEVLWTGESVDCSKLVQTTPTCNGPGNCPAGSECVITQASVTSTAISGVCVDFKQVELKRGRTVLGPDVYGILPSFVGHYRGKGYPDSLVYLGACRSLWNGSMGMEFFGAGAKAVIGYSGYVSNEYAYEQGTEFFSALLEEMKLTGDALPVADEDPANPGTIVRLLGAPNLNATNAELINASWETGDLTGWQKEGDGRTVSRLGITVPVEGKFMSLISTGMGFTPQVGEIFQTFCVPEDKVEMSFYWKFYSEEFKEWCGSSFMDTFEATLEGDDGMITFVDVNIDSLCPPGECFGSPECGAQYDGLIQSDVIFDQGDVWNTHWRKAASNVMALAGAGSVTLRFFSTDVGDSIYDSVILIDTVKFK